MDRLLVRPAEVAEILGLGRTKVCELLASGALPSVRIGKSVRVPLDELRYWIDARVQAGDDLHADDRTNSWKAAR